VGPAKVHLADWGLSARALWERLAPRRGHRDCPHAQSVWHRLRGQRPLVRMHGSQYCIAQCLERALTEALGRGRTAAGRALPAAHRIPLGLMLLSRQQLTVEQLRAALEAQQAAGCGRIGEWMQRLGLVTEQQVTAALARQWSCPVLRGDPTQMGSDRVPEIPLSLLQSLRMAPINFVESTSTLHIAFAEGIDYTVLYAIEQMLGCRTDPCLIAPSVLAEHLRKLAERHAHSEFVFDRLADAGEFARIIRSYATRVAASEIRMGQCGRHIWVRLERLPQSPMNLVLTLPAPSEWKASRPVLASVLAPAV